MSCTEYTSIRLISASVPRVFRAGPGELITLSFAVDRTPVQFNPQIPNDPYLPTADLRRISIPGVVPSTLKCNGIPVPDGNFPRGEGWDSLGAATVTFEIDATFVPSEAVQQVIVSGGGYGTWSAGFCITYLPALPPPDPDESERARLRSCCPPYDTVCLGGFPNLDFGEVSYHGAYPDEVPASMGYGWKCRYFARLVEESDDLTFHDGAGSFERWTRQGDGSYKAAYPDNYTRAASRPGGGWTLTWRDNTRILFDAQGRPEQVLDRNDNPIFYDYVPSGPHQGRLDRIRDAHGREVVMDYEDDGQLRSTTALPGNRVTRYEYHPDRRLMAIVNPANERTEFTYSGGRLWKVFDPPNSAAKQVAAVEYAYYGSGPNAGKVRLETSYGLRQNEYAYGKTATQNDLLTVTSRDLTAVDGDPDPVSPPARVQKFEFDSRFRIRATVDPLQNRVEYFYEDPVNPYLVTQVTDPNGTTLYNHNQFGNLKDVVDAQGRKTSLTYVGEDDPTVGPDDPRFHLVSTVKRPPATQPLHDDGLDLEEQGPAEDYAVTRFRHDLRGNLIAVQDALGQEMCLFRRVDGPPPCEVPDSDSDVYWQPGEPQDGRVKAIMDRNRHITRFGYHGTGNVSSITTPATLGSDRDYRLTTEFAYRADNFDQLETVTEPFDGVGDPTVWRYAFDALDRLTRITDPRGTREQHQDPDLSRSPYSTAFEYIDGLLRTVAAPANRRALESAGPLYRTDPRLGNAPEAHRPTRYRFDVASRLERVLSFVTESLPDEMRVRYGFDGFGNLARMFRLKGGQEVKKVECRYDALDRPSAMLHPARSETSQGNWPPSTGLRSTVTHDTFCKGFTSVAARGVENRVDFDNLCRLTEVSNVDGTMSYLHDELGRLIKTVQPGGPDASRYSAARYSSNRYGSTGTLPEVKTFQFDALDRLLVMTFPDGKTIQYQYFAEGQVRSVIDVHGHKTEYTYYDDDRLWTVTYEGQYTFRYGYDRRGRLMDITYPTSTGVRAAFIWNVAGLLEEIHYTRQDKMSLVTLHRMQYWYDPSGNRTRFLDTLMDGTQTLWDYWYDGLNRLEWVFKNGAMFSYYRFDESDNRIAFERQELPGGPKVLTEYFVDPGRDELLYTVVDGQKREEFTHDLDGNVLGRRDLVTGDRQVYTINALDRPIRIQFTKGQDTESWQHAYDAGNLRKAKQKVGDEGTRVDYYSVGLPILSDSTVAAEADRGTQSYIIAQEVLGYIHEDGAYCLITDHLSSVRAVCDSTGNQIATYEYDEYGAQSGDGGRFTFLGGVSSEKDDASRLIWTSHRLYDPTLGRFLSRDPLRSANDYLYGGGDPVNRSDPSGLAPGETDNQARLIDWTTRFRDQEAGPKQRRIIEASTDLWIFGLGITALLAELFLIGVPGPEDLFGFVLKKYGLKLIAAGSKRFATGGIPKGWLRASEELYSKCGAHAFSTHVNITPAGLRARLAQNASLKVASKFNNEAVAEAMIEGAIRDNRKVVDIWAKEGFVDQLEIAWRGDLKTITGVGITQAGGVVHFTGAKVILRYDRQAERVYIFNAFPYGYY